MSKLSNVISIIAVFAFLSIVASCKSDFTREAIARQLELYPESRVQDIYKYFCQDNLGPGHMIANYEGAKYYMEAELQEYRQDLEAGLYERPAMRYMPVGDNGNYIRVDLSVVLDSIVDPDTLLNAFVRSANEGITLSEERWNDKWGEISDIIRRYYSDIPDASADLVIIDSLMAGGHFIFHHSKEYEDAYHPHYRIVSRDIFIDEIQDKL